MKISLTDFTTLTFDCYGTLIDWESGLWDALQPLIATNVRDGVTRNVALAAFGELESAQRSETRHITVYVSNDDNALALPREVNGYPRLGEASSHVVTLEGVEVIDVSALPVRRVTGHLYHLYNEPVFSDIGELLNKRLGAADRTLPRPVDPTLSNYWKIPAPEE